MPACVYSYRQCEYCRIWRRRRRPWASRVGLGCMLLYVLWVYMRSHMTECLVLRPRLRWDVRPVARDLPSPTMHIQNLRRDRLSFSATICAKLELLFTPASCRTGHLVRISSRAARPGAHQRACDAHFQSPGRVLYSVFWTVNTEIQARGGGGSGDGRGRYKDNEGAQRRAQVRRNAGYRSAAGVAL